MQFYRNALPIADISCGSGLALAWRCFSDGRFSERPHFFFRRRIGISARWSEGCLGTPVYARCLGHCPD